MAAKKVQEDVDLLRSEIQKMQESMSTNVSSLENLQKEVQGMKGLSDRMTDLEAKIDANQSKADSQFSELLKNQAKSDSQIEELLKFMKTGRSAEPDPPPMTHGSEPIEPVEEEAEYPEKSGVKEEAGGMEEEDCIIEGFMEEVKPQE